jgi:hypothetical protein
MEDIFITEFLNLDNEFKELGVFDSIINRDSPFFINLLRLKVRQSFKVLMKELIVSIEK